MSCMTSIDLVSTMASILAAAFAFLNFLKLRDMVPEFYVISSGSSVHKFNNEGTWISIPLSAEIHYKNVSANNTTFFLSGRVIVGDNQDQKTILDFSLLPVLLRPNVPRHYSLEIHKALIQANLVKKGDLDIGEVKKILQHGICIELNYSHKLFHIKRGMYCLYGWHPHRDVWAPFIEEGILKHAIKKRIKRIYEYLIKTPLLKHKNRS